MSNSWPHPRTDSPSLVEPSTHSTTDTSCSSRKPSVEKRSTPSSFVQPTRPHFERAKLSSLAILVLKWFRQFPLEIPKFRFSIMKFARVKLASPTKPCSKLKILPPERNLTAYGSGSIQSTILVEISRSTCSNGTFPHF